MSVTTFNQAEDSHYITIGKIGSPYGIKGWVKITAFTQAVSNILNLQPWSFYQNHSWVELKVEAAKIHGKGIIAKLELWNSPETVKQLTGISIGVKKSQLPTLNSGEYYWRDLEGLTVISHTGEILGTVQYLIETGRHEVVVIKGKKEFALPYLPGTVILNIDLPNKEMHVHWDVI